jgi:hypothetical protein
VPDFDINYGLGDRIQLKYELPIAIEEIRPLPATPGAPAQAGHVIAGLGESLLGIKWRFYEHHPGESWIKDRFGTGLLGVFGHHAPPPLPASDSGDSPGAKDAPEQVFNFSVSTYPQIFLDNPTSAVQRGLVARGPDFLSAARVQRSPGAHPHQRRGRLRLRQPRRPANLESRTARRPRVQRPHRSLSRIL